MTTFLSTEQFYRQGARTLRREYFTAPDIFALERERIFAREWVCIGRESELTQPGDFRVVEIAGESLILVRDRDAALRALFNVCRHRGSRLCDRPEGRLGGTIQCPYHAWTYALDGSLVGAPHMKEVDGFDRAEWGLHPAHAATWHGFAFISIADAPRPLADALAPLVARAAHFGLGALRPARRITYEVRANWKLIVQNYSECQHCPVIHPALVRLSPYDSGANDLVEGPILGGYMAIAQVGGSMTRSGRSCGVPVGDIPAEEHGRVYYYSVFPNLLLSLHPDYVMYHVLTPLAPDRTIVDCEWLFHPDTLTSGAHDPEDAIAFWDETNRQDWHICEESQLGVSSRAYTPGPYSPRESLLAAWDAEYLRRLGGRGELPHRAGISAD